MRRQCINLDRKRPSRSVVSILQRRCPCMHPCSKNSSHSRISFHIMSRKAALVLLHTLKDPLRLIINIQARLVHLFHTSQRGQYMHNHSSHQPKAMRNPTTDNTLLSQDTTILKCRCSYLRAHIRRQCNNHKRTSTKINQA